MTKFDAFTQAYIDAALWSSVAYGSPNEFADDPDHEGTFDGSFEQCNYDASDLSPELLEQILEDCCAFQADHVEDLANAGTPAQNGHDFWLTRNHHGAGFWDRGYPADLGRRLSEAAHDYGSEDLYVADSDPNDTGKICA